MQDIETRQDIETFMTLFYDRLLADPVAAPLFDGTDMQAHMPRVIAFWQGIAFGKGGYEGSPFAPHVPLALEPEHFTIWYATFTSCLDDLYAGETADLLRERAHSIAHIFSHKLGLGTPRLQPED